jgi:lipoprotein-anchoring transpeptidase ErfK/SrfK
MDVRTIALTFLIMIGALVASDAHAQQPLTRAHCEQAGMTWDDAANVCAAAETANVAEETGNLEGQPLTRIDCESAGLSWNETGNVCEAKPEEAATETAVSEPEPAAPILLINIDKATQRMTVFLDGSQQYDWPVSTGLPGYATPSGTYAASSMNRIWYSKEWDNAPMPHAVFFTREGHAIHGTYEVKRLGRPASHGCVRLSPQNAATLYDLVAKTGLKNTQVVLAGLTPGGEAKVASQRSPKSRYREFAQGESKRDWRQKRGGFFRRFFGGLSGKKPETLNHAPSPAVVP